MAKMKRGEPAIVLFIYWTCLGGFLDSTRINTHDLVGDDVGQCNVTLSGEAYVDAVYGPVSLRLIGVTDRLVGAPLTCRYRFAGAPVQRVLIHVHKLIAGHYDEDTNRCTGGYLKLWDGSHEPGRHRYPPNTLCGHHGNSEISVDKFSSSPVAEIEFYAAHAHKYSAFVVTYKYVNMELKTTPYPRQLWHQMKLVEHTASVCYWRLVTGDCGPECSLMSPGYPGIYPPTMECYYHVTSRNPHVAFQIRSDGLTEQSKPREFDIVDSDECRTEYLEVYDSESTENEATKLGRFCGRHLPSITTSSNNVFFVFVSRQDAPPYRHKGFHISLLTITKEWHQDGLKLPSTSCDWTFNASEGSVSSPDYWLPERTTCSYTFHVRPRNYLQLILNIYGLSPVSSPRCNDRIDILEDTRLIVRICSHDLKKDASPFGFNVSASSVTLRYYTTSGQMESRHDKGFWLSFSQHLDTRGRHESSTRSNERAQPVIDTVNGSWQIFTAVSCLQHLLVIHLCL